MKSRFSWHVLLVLTGLCVVPGCEQWHAWFPSADAATEADDEFAELGTEDDFETNAAPLAAVPETATGGPVLAAEPSSLQLNLKVGDRFPLLKSVEQNLLQSSPQGAVRSSSFLEMMLAVTVEEVPLEGERAGQKRMGVKYHRVRYARDIAGERVDFDSQTSAGQVPAEAQPYRGLVGNGFYFWLGADNQLVEMVGFEQFLKRCLEGVPAEQRQQVVSTLVANSGGDSIANFVDDSIGLLPVDTVELGDTWSITRDVFEPLRMHVKTQYTLHRLDSQIAEISIMGRIDPSASYGAPDTRQPVDVTVRGGRSYGSCTIDRRTGLPIESRVDQTLEMTVKLVNGVEFEQQKQTVTTIRAFPDQQSGGLAQQPAPGSGVLQTSAAEQPVLQAPPAASYR